ncbi:PAS domain-containing protein [Winslowiella toletana]|uniref:PAS domain-containing protein n=1 Tax=Winslowiella toletana TaxID=92490 RepID=UPI0028BE5D2C|nr:PAS domain-containing protein [Winslowiella toletana]WNN43204.1 PAS domain-containing protein [Winslowiella toletana]
MSSDAFSEKKKSISNHMSLPKMLTNTLDQMHEPYAIKDINSRYIYANRAIAKLVGLSSPDYMLTKQESELESRLTESQYIVDEWQHQDRIVVQNHKSITMLEIHLQQLNHPYIIRKLPFYDDGGHCVGVVLHSKSIENFNLNKYIKINAPSSLLLNKPDEFFNEPECEFVFLKLQRMSNKEIATVLQLSYAAVDEQIGKIYEKCDVTHTDDFIEFCERRNYHRYLPESFIQQKGNVFKKDNNFII